MCVYTRTYFCCKIIFIICCFNDCINYHFAFTVSALQFTAKNFYFSSQTFSLAFDKSTAPRHYCLQLLMHKKALPVGTSRTRVTYREQEGALNCSSASLRSCSPSPVSVFPGLLGCPAPSAGLRACAERGCARSFMGSLVVSQVRASN